MYNFHTAALQSKPNLLPFFNTFARLCYQQLQLESRTERESAMAAELAREQARSAGLEKEMRAAQRKVCPSLGIDLFPLIYLLNPLSPLCSLLPKPLIWIYPCCELPYAPLHLLLHD